MNIDRESIINILDNYIEQKNPKYALMINGAWGIGKTYFIKRYIHGKNSKCKNMEESKIYEFKILLCEKIKTLALIFNMKFSSEQKVYYLSLYGLNDIGELKLNLIYTIMPSYEIFLKIINVSDYNKKLDLIKNIITFIYKILLSLLNIVFWIIPFKGLKKISLCLDRYIRKKISVYNILTQKTIILDDLERTEIEYSRLFGFINYLLENENCKIILIGNEEKINEKYNYNEIKEKTIGKFILIDKMDLSVIDDMINVELFDREIDSTDPRYKLLLSNVKIIYEVYEKSKTKNLRLLRYGLIGFLEISIILLKKNKISESNLSKLLHDCINVAMDLYVEDDNDSIDKKTIYSSQRNCIREFLTNYNYSCINLIEYEEFNIEDYISKLYEFYKLSNQELNFVIGYIADYIRNCKIKYLNTLYSIEVIFRQLKIKDIYNFNENELTKLIETNINYILRNEILTIQDWCNQFSYIYEATSLNNGGDPVIEFILNKAQDSLSNVLLSEIKKCSSEEEQISFIGELFTIKQSASLFIDFYDILIILKHDIFSNFILSISNKAKYQFNLQLKNFLASNTYNKADNLTLTKNIYSICEDLQSFLKNSISVEKFLILEIINSLKSIIKKSQLG